MWQVRASYDDESYCKIVLGTWGDKVHPSSSIKVGRQILDKDPNSPGSLGIAVSEGMEMALRDLRTKYLAICSFRRIEDFDLLNL